MQERRVTLGLLRLLFKPAIRYCLDQSISVHEALEALKTVFVECAAEEISQSNNKVTASRISAMSGINRRDVTRIYRGEHATAHPPNLAMRVLSRWEQEERWQTKSGQPRVLSYKGENSEFKQLVASESKDINPATLLFELQRIGALKRARDGVKMLKAVTYHHQNPEKVMELISQDVDSLVSAARENAFQPQSTRNLHLRTEYDNVFKEDIAQIRQWLFQEGAQFHKKVRDFLSQYDMDINPNPDKTGGARVVLGAFSCTSGGQEPLSVQEGEDGQQRKTAAGASNA